jgi:hypothetical protein
MDLLEIGWDGVDWIGVAQDRDNWTALVTAVMNIAERLSNANTTGGRSSSVQLLRDVLVRVFTALLPAVEVPLLSVCRPTIYTNLILSDSV